MGSLFPDPTKDEQDHMHRLARRIVRQVGIRGDNALIEDLEMAGWIAFYRFFTRDTRWLKVRDTMMDAWCLWCFGVTHRGKKEQRERTVLMVPVEEWTLFGSSQQRIEGQLEARNTLDALSRTTASSPRHGGLDAALRGIALADGGPLTPAERLSCGITHPSTYASQKQILRRLVIDLQRDAA